MSNTLLKPDTIAGIEKWLKKYPSEQRQSALLAALTLTQKQNGGWLTDELIEAVADYLDIPAIAAFEAATFYSMYELKPVGRHKIGVCVSISCLLRGSEQVSDHLEKCLGVKVGETTADGKFTLKHVECLAACANAPVALIDEKYHEDLTPEKIDQILKSLE